MYAFDTTVRIYDTIPFLYCKLLILYKTDF